MARHEPETKGADGVARLVEAERAWDQSLATARAASVDAVHAAQADAKGIEEAAAAEVARAVSARRQELEQGTTRAVRELEAEVAARLARYAEAPDATVETAALLVADAAPWLVPGDGARS